MAKGDKLTDKQLLFCQEYIVDLNATQAAIRAGYSEDSAYSTGHDNLKKPEIEKKIQEYMDLRSKRTEITADRVLTELAKLGFSDAKHLFTSGGAIIPLQDLPTDVSACIQSVEVVTRPTGEKDENGYPIVENIHKIRMADKKASLELLAKNLKLVDSRTVVEGKVDHAHKHTVVSDETKSVLEQLAGHGEGTGDTTPSTH